MSTAQELERAIGQDVYDVDGQKVGARKDAIKDAPRIDDQGHLSEAEATELYRHYNLQAAQSDPKHRKH